jgi:hypothetical protein
MERDDSPRQRHGEGGPAPTGAQGGALSVAECPVAKSSVHVISGGSSMPGRNWVRAAGIPRGSRVRAAGIPRGSRVRAAGIPRGSRVRAHF